MAHGLHGALTAQIRDIIQESLPAFGTSAIAGYGGARGTKTAPVLRTAEELGLSTRRGQSRVLPSRSKVKVKVDTEKGTARV